MDLERRQSAKDVKDNVKLVKDLEEREKRDAKMLQKAHTPAERLEAGISLVKTVGEKKRAISYGYRLEDLDNQLRSVHEPIRLAQRARTLHENRALYDAMLLDHLQNIPQAAPPQWEGTNQNKLNAVNRVRDYLNTTNDNAIAGLNDDFDYALDVLREAAKQGN